DEEIALTLESDHTLTAILRKVPKRAKPERRAWKIGTLENNIRSMGSVEVKSLRMKLSLTDPSTLPGLLGPIKSMILEDFTFRLSAKLGSRRGLDASLEVSGGKDSIDDLRFILTQLRDVLDSADLEISLEMDSFKRLSEILSPDAAAVLDRRGEGMVSIRMVVRREEGRSMDRLFEGG
ncbi:MAG: hypothetical protein DRO06_02015, partial [Thermoproteota archaeon]